MSGRVRTRLMPVILALCLLTTLTTGVSAGQEQPRTGDLHLLLIMPNNYGANYYILRDILEQYGWCLTTTAVTPTVEPCPAYAEILGCPPVTVDVVTDSITDVTVYDAVLVMFGSANVPNPCGDLLADQHALDLIHTADEEGLLIGAFCQSVRVLAAADVINGVHVTGNPQFQAEYAQAGGIYVGTGVPPVLDGNILTSIDGLYYSVLICQMIGQTLPPSVAPSGSGEPVPAGGSASVQFDRRDRVLWSTTLGGPAADGGRSICSTSDGGYFIVGYTYSFGAGDADLYVIKTDATGNEEWSRTFGAQGRDYGNAGIEASEGGFVVTGYTTLYGGGGENVFVAKLDAGGTEEWSTILGGPMADGGVAVCETDDGGFVIGGYTFSSGAGQSDAYMAKVNQAGEVQWERTYGTGEAEFGFGLASTQDGGYVVTGLTGYGPGIGNSDIFVVRTDAQGQELWRRSFGGTTYDQGSSIVATPDSGFVICGQTDVLYAECMDAYLTKLGAQGTQQWGTRFREGQFYDYGRALCLTPEGGFAIAGGTKNPVTGKNDVYVIAAEADGSEFWKSIIGGSGIEWGSGICATNDGYVVTGHTDAEAAGAFDVLLLKVSSLTAQFDMAPNTGHAPLQVAFSDHSWGSPGEWAWDFDADGSVDSPDQSPLWTYTEPGTYSVRLTVTNSSWSDTLLQEACIRVFDGESALRFNGHDGAATCPSSPSLSLTDAMTVEAWISPEGWGEVTSTGYGRIIDKGNIALYLHGEGAAYNQHSAILLVRNESGPPHVYVSPTNSVTLGGWSHLAATYDGDNGHASICVNGIEQELTCASPASGPIRDNAAIDLLIGNGPSGTFTFDGIIDEVRVWNVVRAPGEIAETMDHYLVGSEQGLVGYWTMNEGIGNVLEDGSPSGNDATITGAEWWQGTPFHPDGIEDGITPPTIPSFALYSGYPNPFTERAMIRYDLPVACPSQLAIFDIAGRAIRTLVDGFQPKGAHCACWDGRDQNGREAPSGIYFCRMRSGDFSAARKLLLVR